MDHVRQTGVGVLIVMLLCIAGCRVPGPVELPPPSPSAGLPVKSDVQIVQEQDRAHPTLRLGEFLSMADFEHRGDQDVKRQLDWFTVEPSTGHSTLRLSTQARSGRGALEAQLWRGESVRFNFPQPLDASDYWLIQLSVQLPQRRDDLQLTFHSRQGAWTSPRSLLGPGWNDVKLGLTELKRLTNLGRFDIRAITGITIRCTNLTVPLTVRFDDILLLDNSRRIKSTPAKVGLWTWGGDYALRLGGWKDPLRIERGEDGLWRIGAMAPSILCGRGETPTRAVSDSLGLYRVGQIKIIESNRIRLRMESSALFPLRHGAWSGVSTRYLRSRWTFYSDGRWVTELAMNNSGGDLMQSLRIKLPREAAWSTRKTVSDEWTAGRHVGPVRRWCYLHAPTDSAKTQFAHYLSPAKLEVRYGKYVYVPGDVMGDAFDESQGCYVVGGRNGQCRFTLRAKQGTLGNCVLRVMGPWKTSPTVRVEGGIVDTVELLADGSALFVIDTLSRGGTKVDVTVSGTMQPVVRPGL
ncbi:MAG: hypothetical protein HN370_07880 [Phycisphaerales bacterium]|jgi:hypothetical protein|nr:hypothetical protein [Phycisphaerales bacterium]